MIGMEYFGIQFLSSSFSLNSKMDFHELEVCAIDILH